MHPESARSRAPSEFGADAIAALRLSNSSTRRAGGAETVLQTSVSGAAGYDEGQVSASREAAAYDEVAALGSAAAYDEAAA